MAVAQVRKLRSLVTALLWCLLVLGSGTSFCSGDKVDVLLKRLNKPYVKSIKSADGDTIDCVHISKQPAIDNPSLKDHSIKMRPSFIPTGLFNENNVSIKQTWQSSGMCPKDTIPIRRTTREDILRANTTIESFGKKQYKSVSLDELPADSTPKHEYAAARITGDKYYGSTAYINLWAPKVMIPQEFSLSQLWIAGGISYSDLNTVEVGWQIYPQIYGDYNPRLFVYWTSDGYKSTGCYNLKCSGFVQISSKLVVGGTLLGPVSSYNGAQYVIGPIIVWKDTKTGNWWLSLGNELVGYWPSTLFSHLNKYAERLTWGGEIINYASGGSHTTTQMGSGHFPSEGFGKASYFKRIGIIDTSYNIKPPPNLSIITDPSKYCYDIKIGVTPLANWGAYFFYGGPGRSSACP